MQKCYTLIIYLTMLFSILSSSLVSYMYYKGAYYYNKLNNCQDSFCGISVFDYSLPDDLRQELLNISQYAKRVNIQNWKYGRTVSTNIMPPNVISFYKEFADTISMVVGTNVYPTPLNLPTSSCMLVYDMEGDFINWHFDVNYFDGRFFTVLIPVTLEESATKFKYKDKQSNDIMIDLGKINKSIVFEGDNLFHMATKLSKKDNPRIVLSLQYATNTNINMFNRLLMGLKDLAYVPVF